MSYCTYKPGFTTFHTDCNLTRSVNGLLIVSFSKYLMNNDIHTVSRSRVLKEMFCCCDTWNEDLFRDLQTVSRTLRSAPPLGLGEQITIGAAISELKKIDVFKVQEKYFDFYMNTCIIKNLERYNENKTVTISTEFNCKSDKYGRKKRLDGNELCFITGVILLCEAYDHEVVLTDN